MHETTKLGATRRNRHPLLEVNIQILALQYSFKGFDETEAISMIQETRASQIVAGARGRAPADTEALAKALACLSQLAYANRDQIESIDINPLVVLEQGQGVVALDALVMLSSPTF